MISEYLQTLFFAVDKIFGEGILIYCASLIVVGIVFSIIYQLTKR
jgi:hypothetical protein